MAESGWPREYVAIGCWTGAMREEQPLHLISIHPLQSITETAEPQRGKFTGSLAHLSTYEDWGKKCHLMGGHQSTSNNNHPIHLISIHHSITGTVASQRAKFNGLLGHLSN